MTDDDLKKWARETAPGFRHWVSAQLAMNESQPGDEDVLFTVIDDHSQDAWSHDELAALLARVEELAESHASYIDSARDDGAFPPENTDAAKAGLIRGSGFGCHWTRLGRAVLRAKGGAA